MNSDITLHDIRRIEIGRVEEFSANENHPKFYLRRILFVFNDGSQFRVDANAQSHADLSLHAVQSVIVRSEGTVIVIADEAEVGA